MKIRLTIILLAMYVISKGQISILETSNDILISPDIMTELSDELVNFYLVEYEEKKLEMEMESDTEESDKRQISLKKDIQTLEEYLNLWNKETSLTTDFVEEHDKSKCYELDTDIGKLGKDSYEIKKTKGETIIFYEEIEVEKKDISARWVREDINCPSPSSDDCYAYCLVKTGGVYIFEETGDSTLVQELSDAYYFDSDASMLIREIEITEDDYKIVDKDSQKARRVFSWLEKDCK